MRRRVSFHVLLPPESEFRQHLPAVLPIHARRVCIRRTTGRCCQNFDSDGSKTWKLTIYTSTGCQKTWTIQNGYGRRICIDTHTNGRISFGRETPNCVTRPTYDNDKRWRLIIPKVAVKTGYRRSGETVQWRGGAVPRCSESPPTGPGLQNKKNNIISTKFRQNLPCTGRFPKPAKKAGSMADSTYMARRPHIQANFKLKKGALQQIHIYGTSGGLPTRPTREVMPKLRLESGQTMGASLINASAGCPSSAAPLPRACLCHCTDLSF
jgi:hypothetical protein